jgi:hypothetical protein
MTLERRIARAWRAAADDLAIAVSSADALVDLNSRAQLSAVHVVDFGGPRGAICAAASPASDVFGQAVAAEGFFFSSLHAAYAEYERALFRATLDDWGWYGTGDPPEWYTGEPWR